MAEGFGFSLEKGAERRHALKQTPMEPVAKSNRWLKSNQLNKDETIKHFQDEVYKLVQINNSMQGRNEYLEKQHEQDLCQAEFLKEQLHHLQYDYNIFARETYDANEREKRELLSDNDKLIKENKTLIVERDDLRKQRDELTCEATYVYRSKTSLSDEQTKKNNLKLEKFQSNACTVGHEKCERLVTFHKNRATIIDNKYQELKEKNIQLWDQTVELRKKRNAIQKKNEKRFRRDVPVTITNRSKNGSKLTGTGRPPQQIDSPKKEKTTTSENDDSTIAYIHSLNKECGEWKLKNEQLNTRIGELEKQLETNNHQLSSFENETQNLKYTVLKNEKANSKLKSENENIQSEFKLYQKTTQRELHSLRETIRKHEQRIESLDDEKNKLEQERKMITRQTMKEKEYQESEMQEHKKALEKAHEAHHDFQLKIKKLELHIVQSADQLRVAVEQLNIEKSRNNILLKKMSRYEKTVEKLRVMTETYQSERSINNMLSYEKAQCERTVETLEEVNQELKSQLSMSMKKDKFEEIVDKLRVLNEKLEYEMSRNDMLNKERNNYKEQVEYMRKSHSDFAEYHEYIQITTEKNQQLERQISSLKKTEQDLAEEIESQNNEIREFKNNFAYKDRDVRNLQIELQRKYQEIEEKVNEIAVINETNVKYERLVSDLQTEINHYKSYLTCSTPDSSELTNTVSTLKCEVENYQRELEKARVEIENAAKNSHHMDQIRSDLEKSEQACRGTVNSLKEKMRELTKRTDSDINNLKFECQRKCKEIENAKTELFLVKEQNKTNEQLVTDLQIELDQYKRNLKDNDTNSLKMGNATKNTLIKAEQAFIEEIGSLNAKVRELTNILKQKDSDVRKMETKMTEFSSIEEKNNKLEQQVRDLQIEVNQYRSDLNDKSFASDKLTNSISKLRREAEKYQSELNQARDELRNATENTQQMERQFSDLKKSAQAFTDETDYLNDTIRALTNTLKRKDTDVRKMETKMAEFSSIEEINIKLERQVTDLQSEVNQYKSDLNDKISASAKLTNTISNLRREAKTYQSELNQARYELRNATDNIQKIERQISDLKMSEQALIDERGSLNDNIRQLTDILKGKDSVIQKIEKKLAEYSLIKEENAKAERQITDLQIEIKQYKSELKDKSDNLTKQTNAFSILSHESERCKSELKEAHEKIRKLNLQLKTVNDEHEKCNHLISSLRKENAKLSMYKDNDQTRRSEATLNQREHELSLALEKSRRELREVQHELDDTKTRLSKVMGQKLTDNNPNIADLSDKNRPTKLAERYSELYDNQWTDAFEVICKRLHDENSTIESLIGILMNAAKYCREEAMKQLETIQGILLPRKTGSTFPSLVHKNLKDCRKALGEQTGAAIYEKYLQDIAKQRHQSLQLDVKPYVKECVELCWLMSIQDPPVVVAPEIQHGGNFDTDFYKAYTKSGPLIDYVVWPALCLHEKGPLLCKGIAQGYGGKKTKH